MEATPPRDAVTAHLPATLPHKKAAQETGVYPGLPPAVETGVRDGLPSVARNGRETMLSFMLVAVFGGAIFFFLNFVALGIFVYVIGAVVGVTAVGFLHYVLWGYDLSEEVAEEMQRERLKQQQEMDERLR